MHTFLKFRTFGSAQLNFKRKTIKNYLSEYLKKYLEDRSEF